MPKTPPTPEPGTDTTPAVKSLPRAALSYVGGGAAVPGVPPRDLTLDEAEQLHPDHYAEALASGLYVAKKEA